MKGRALSTMGALLTVLVLQAHGSARADLFGATEAVSILAGVAGGVDPNAPGAVIRVADPTGDPTTDRANIEDAIARARPGDTVLFAAGTYVIGRPPPSLGISVPVGDVSLLGSPEGTTIRGGRVPDTGEFQLGFSFIEAGNSVRRLTFESFSTALLVGDEAPATGGYTFENNVFRRVVNGIFGALDSSTPTHIARNEFINVAVQYAIDGGILHFSNNTSRTPDPEAIPRFHRPLFAGLLLGFAGLECNENVIENNFVFDNVDGFQFVAVDAACRRNVMRNNIVSINQALLGELDLGTLAVMDGIAAPLDNNLIEGNLLAGTMGIGILASDVTNSTFQGNVIFGVRRKPDLPPGLGPGGVAMLFAGKDRGNAVASNRLENNQFCDVWLRRNTVNNVVVEPNDTVLDRGRRNQVLSVGSCGAEASAIQSEEIDDQVAISEKVKLVLGKSNR